MQPGSQRTIDSAALQYRRAAAGYEECKINREAPWEKKKKKGILERKFLDPDSDLLTGSRFTPGELSNTDLLCSRSKNIKYCRETVLNTLALQLPY